MRNPGIAWRSGLKRRMRNTVYFLLYYAGFVSVGFWLIRHFSRVQPVGILMYHRFCQDGDSDLLPRLPVGRFESHLRCLKKQMEVISLNEFVERRKEGKAVLQPSVILTIDDGYVDNYELAFPVLERLALPATIYLTAGLIGTEQGLWLDDIEEALRNTRKESFVCKEVFGEREVRIRTDEEKRGALRKAYEVLLRRPNSDRRGSIERLLNALEVERKGFASRKMMSWEETKEMAEKGICFGAHTMTHPTLSAEKEEEAEQEIRESKSRIEEELGAPVRHFAIPNGQDEDFREALRGYCRAIGFDSVVTTNFGAILSSDDPFALRRLPGSEPVHVFSCVLLRAFLGRLRVGGRTCTGEQGESISPLDRTA